MKYRCVVREYTTYEVYVDARYEREAIEKATELYENGALYKDIYDCDLVVSAYEEEE